MAALIQALDQPDFQAFADSILASLGDSRVIQERKELSQQRERELLRSGFPPL